MVNRQIYLLMIRFKELNMIDRMPEELRTEFRNIVQEAVTKTIPRKRNVRRQSGCLSRLCKQLRKEEKQKATEKGKVKSLSRVRLFVTPWTVAYQAPLSMGFSRQECWSGLPFPSPGDLPDPGIEPGSPALQADALPSEPPGKTEKGKDVPK